MIREKREVTIIDLRSIIKMLTFRKIKVYRDKVKTMKKIMIGLVLLVIAAGAVFEYLNHQKSQEINRTNIEKRIKKNGFSEKTNPKFDKSKGVYLLSSSSWFDYVDKLVNVKGGDATDTYSYSQQFELHTSDAKDYTIRCYVSGRIGIGSKGNLTYIPIIVDKDGKTREIWVISDGGETSFLTKLSQIPSNK